MALRRGIRSLAGLNSSGGTVNIPDPNPPVAPPENQQTVALQVISSPQTIFNTTVTRSSSTQGTSLPQVTLPLTVLTPTITTSDVIEPFTGTSGAPDATRWGAATMSAGATVGLDNNQLRMVGGTVGGFNDWQYLPSLFSVNNMTMTLDVLIGTGNINPRYIQIGFRGSGVQDPTAGHRAKQTTGYFVEIAPGNNYLQLLKRTGGIDASLGFVTLTWADNDTIHLRINAVNGSLRVRYWRNAETEPLSWNIDVTDPTYTSGRVWLGHNGGNDANPDTVRFDNLTVAFTNEITNPPPSGTYLDPPTAEALVGLNATAVVNYDWTGATPLAGWALFDEAVSASLRNGERSAPRPQNVTVVTGEAGTTGSAYLRLIVRRENYAGYPLSGVQMETGAIKVGQGAPFYMEVRLRWTGYLGFWGGPWLLQYPQSPNREMDIMETVNTRPPWTTSHFPSIATQAYAATNDGNWHRYGMRVDSTTVKWFFDNVKVLQLNDATTASAFMNAQMFPKIQHLAGGNFPNSDNGSLIVDNQLPTFDRYFDVDYMRFYR
jgi:hypothetical protein